MNLENIITEYINNVEWKKSFLLHGDWGVGKTHNLKKFFTSNNNKNKLKNHTHYCFVNGYDITDDFNLKKHIFNNSYKIGTTDLDPIVNDVISKMQKNYEKLPFWIKNAIKAIENGTKATAKTKGVEFEISGILSKFFDEHVEYICQSPKIKECIVIIDELDRNSLINIKLIFSKVIDLLENLNMKVILVCNIEELKLNSDFHTWSEKVIDFKIEYKGKENNRIDHVVSQFSEFFRDYFRKNRSSFSNNRTYIRYKSFEKIIDDEYIKYYTIPSKLRLINSFKETIFYSLYMSENPNKFEQDFKTNDKLATYIPYRYLKQTLKFISLDFNPLYSEINKSLLENTEQNNVLRDAYFEYENSKKICHSKHKNYAIENPKEYISNILKKHIKILILLNPEKVLRINPYNHLSYWIKELALYEENGNLNDYILTVLVKKFDDTIITEDNSNQSKMKFFNKTDDQILEDYIIEYKDYQEFLNYVKNKIKDKKNNIKEELKNKLDLEDDEFIVKYFVENIDDLLKYILESSNNYFYDLAVIKKHEPEFYEKMIRNYLEKNPNENERVLKNYIIDKIEKN